MSGPLARSTASPTRLAAMISGLARGEGFSASRLPGVRFMRSTLHVPNSPIIYDPSIVIIAQGRKIGTFADRKVIYDESHYLVLAVPLPFECETIGSSDEPVLGISIDIHPALVAELLLQMPEAPHSEEPPHPIDAATLDDALALSAERLVACLHTDADARILGPALVREITYRVLQGPLGHQLRALAAPDSHLGQISRVLHRMHTEYADDFDMALLAREAGMSATTFHTHFKSVTSSSPLQYLKNVRLHKARLLMVHDGANAGDAALQVGYESASQFSREFKRLFGKGPAAEALRLRRALIRLA